MCVLCVQYIGKCQRELQDPSTGEGRRSDLEGMVKSDKSLIQQDNAAISSIDGELAELVGERATILNQGEPPGCHADDCQEWLPWQHLSGTCLIDTKGVSTCRRRGEGMQLPYSQYRGRNAGGY